MNPLLQLHHRGGRSETERVHAGQQAPGRELLQEQVAGAVDGEDSTLGGDSGSRDRVARVIDDLK
ncbi:hypothetical protein [Cystobacter fuscus]|uniref:hypothetical protein n=1 Tax=Cystobacter fuscus TaxID=43 RepID=UPI0012FD124E|nr:hypothetical protein [Cystobacter fuscus]